MEHRTGFEPVSQRWQRCVLTYWTNDATNFVRVERFELITKLILSQPPLPIGLHAQILYSRRDSNPHCTDLESVVSCQLDYASMLECHKKAQNDSAVLFMCLL